MDGGAWLATVHGVAKSNTRLSDIAAAAARQVRVRRAFSPQLVDPEDASLGILGILQSGPYSPLL